jgi:hypothetical protein
LDYYLYFAAGAHFRMDNKVPPLGPTPSPSTSSSAMTGGPTADTNEPEIELILPEPDDISFLQILALLFKQDLQLNDDVKQPTLTDIYANVGKTDPTRNHNIVNTATGNSTTNSNQSSSMH